MSWILQQAAEEARVLCCCGRDVGLVAIAPIQRLAWEPPYAVCAALEKAKRQNKTKETGSGTGWTYRPIQENRA